MNENGRNRPVEILLVEDNPGDIRLTEEALREGRVLNKLHVVRDGIEALEFLGQEGDHPGAARPDIILLDLNMPRMDGRELLAHIKGDKRLRNIPVIVLTTSNSEEDVATAYNLHANCYITKPVDLDQFVRVVKVLETFWINLVTLPPGGNSN